MSDEQTMGSEEEHHDGHHGVPESPWFHVLLNIGLVILGAYGLFRAGGAGEAGGFIASLVWILAGGAAAYYLRHWLLFFVWMITGGLVHLYVGWYTVPVAGWIVGVIWAVLFGLPLWSYRAALEDFINAHVFSVDHKTIAKQYLGIGLLWLAVGGLLAYLFRWQLAYPGEPLTVLGPLLGWGQHAINSYLCPPMQAVLDGSLNQWLSEDLQMGLKFQLVSLPFENGVPQYAQTYISESLYNQLITMHGTIMMFFVALPILLGFYGNFCVPLMIGADDMAFPRINMMSFWTIFVASIFLLLTFFMEGGAAQGGWTAYAPLASGGYQGSAGWGMNFWLLAVGTEFFSILLGGINIITTTFKMRAPGLSLFRLPIMVWMQVVAAFMFLLSVGPLLAGCVMMFLDRVAGTTFFEPTGGGDPLLWQHLFWFFGHPEVYVIMLPGFGILLEILPVFSRKRIFGYRPILYMTFAAGFLSFLVWAHHQFVSGMDPELAAPFMITTILISDPFALMVFAMVATLWGASIEFKTPMLFALGTLLVFIIGGVTGIYLASTPVDIYFHDTQFVVAHFHYTLFSSVIFGGFAGIYYWFPKMTGRLMNEFWGKVHFIFTFVGFNGVFGTMFLLGFGGHIRRIANPTEYPYLRSIQDFNVIATYFAIFLFVGQIPFVVNLVWSRFWGAESGRNPWNANTLEWQAPSPPGHGNFDELPSVYRDPYEYSTPGSSEDWLPQSRDLSPASGSGES